MGLSQRGLAEKLRVSNSVISRWEIDDCLPRISISRLATGYETSEQTIERELIRMRKRIEMKVVT